MKLGWLRLLRDRLANRRQAGERVALDFIKARYHVFRRLLICNDAALESLAALDRLVRESEASHARDEALGLYETALELADGLNRLTGSAHLGLYPRLEILRRELDTALAAYGAAPREAWLPLARVTPDLSDQAGGKAAPLAALLRAGLPVPDGLAISRRACRDYLRQARLDGRLRAIARAATEPGADLSALAAQAGDMIRASAPSPQFEAQLRAAWEYLAQDGPPRLSVRSSATSEDGGENAEGGGRSFAGQFESVLGVTTPEALVDAFKTVLASAFSPRALAYRAAAGILGSTLDMAVLCQRMVDAKASGVLFTLDPMDPASGRMLVTAVPGLGTQAVSGRVPADVYRPVRTLGAISGPDIQAEVAAKTTGEVLTPDGRLAMQDVAPERRNIPLLSPAEIDRLRALALRAEALLGGPRDIEWAMDHGGRIWLLQARPARLAKPAPEGALDQGQVLLKGGAAAAPGKAAGRVAVARTAAELAAAKAAAAEGPIVLALPQSLVDAASLVPEAAAILVDLGNPLDHLACLARELAVPMLTGLETATTALAPGSWVLVDADRSLVAEADPRLWREAPRPASRRAAPLAGPGAALRQLVLPLNLTDAYGPTFSIQEIKSLHDVVRYAHEKAILGMFAAADAITGQAFSLVRRLENAPGLSFLIIDLGGALAPGGRGTVRREDILSTPLAALCQGMAEPGLRWGKPAPIPGTTGLLGRAMLDKRGERPVGEPNYALATRDYLNLNARVDYHFAMVDAVCGPNPRQNSIRFRFKGGGTAREQRERRAAFVEYVMSSQGFFTNRQGDMVTAVLGEGSPETIQERLAMLGRLLGFSRLLDAAMIDDAMPHRVAQAFLNGDYSLDRLAADLAKEKE